VRADPELECAERARTPVEEDCRRSTSGWNTYSRPPPWHLHRKDFWRLRSDFRNRNVKQ